MRRLSIALRLAVRAGLAHPLRSILTSLSIATGVFAVAAVVAAGQSARARIEQELGSFGSTLVVASAASTRATGDGRRIALTVEDAAAVAREASAVIGVAPVQNGTALLVQGQRQHRAPIIGTTRGYFELTRRSIAKGSQFTALEEAAKDKVCVIGERTRREIWGDADPIGQTLSIGGTPLRVVGVLKAIGSDIFGKDQDDLVLMPLESFRARIQPSALGSVSSILLAAADPAHVDRALEQADRVFRARHHVAEGERSDVVLTAQRAAIEALRGSLRSLSALLLLVAAVGLVVGGIGVMNIMLVSVKERRREIGIRMALGARSRDIRAQFLFEALLLSGIGGSAGTLLAAASVLLAQSRLAGWAIELDPMAVAVGLGISSAIGLLFGFFPAREASLTEPVLALGRD